MKKIAFKQWYAIKCRPYDSAGKPIKEELVVKSIENRIKQFGLDDYVDEIIIPTAMVEQERRKPGRGKVHVTDKKQVRRKLMPYTIWIKCEFSEKLYNVIENKSGQYPVLGNPHFVGTPNSTSALNPWEDVTPVSAKDLRKFFGTEETGHKELTKADVRKYLDSLTEVERVEIPLEEREKGEDAPTHKLIRKRELTRLPDSEIEKALAGEPTKIDLDKVRTFINDTTSHYEPNEHIEESPVKEGDKAKITGGVYEGMRVTIAHVVEPLRWVIVQAYEKAERFYVKVRYEDIAKIEERRLS